MKEKIMRKIALLAGAVVVLLLCSNLGTASLEDEAYLEQLIAQYREAVELDPFPNAYENGTIRIESIMEDRQHICELQMKQGELSAQFKTYGLENGQPGELLDGVYYVNGKRYGYSATDDILAMMDAKCPYKNEYDMLLRAFRGLLLQTVREPELANWSRWDPEAGHTRPVIACDLPDVSYEPLPNVLELEFLEPISVDGLGVVERLTAVVCEEPDDGLTAWVTMGDCTVTVE